MAPHPFYDTVTCSVVCLLCPGHCTVVCSVVKALHTCQFMSPSVLVFAGPQNKPETPSFVSKVQGPPRGARALGSCAVPSPGADQAEALCQHVTKCWPPGRGGGGGRVVTGVRLGDRKRSSALVRSGVSEASANSFLISSSPGPPVLPPAGRDHHWGETVPLCCGTAQVAVVAGGGGCLPWL